MGVILSVHESKQHRQALGREEAYHKKEAPAQWSHRGFQVEKMLAGSPSMLSEIMLHHGDVQKRARWGGGGASLTQARSTGI
jgi:hypothetical protein